MLMIGRLMFGKRSMGRRPRETKPRMAMPSDAMRMAMPFLKARYVIHMLFLRDLRADLLPLAHELLALDDHALAAAQALDDFDQRALRDADVDRLATDDALRVHDEHDGRVALVADGLVLDEHGLR